MRFFVAIATLIFYCLLSSKVSSQEAKLNADSLVRIPSNYVVKIESKAQEIDEKITVYSEKALRKLEEQELKLKKKLSLKDSIAANEIFGDVKEKYGQLQNRLKKEQSKLSSYRQYLSRFDTLKTSLRFISENSETFFSSNQELTQVGKALQSVNSLEGKLHGSEAIRRYLRERRDYLREQLGKFGLLKEFEKYNKQVYYYSEQIKEYRNILQEPEKLERKVLGLLSKVPAFQKYFNQHSELASFFGMLGSDFGSFPMAGIQSRASVQQLIQQNIGTPGLNVNSLVQQNIGQAQNQLNLIKQKLHGMGNQFSNSTDDFDMPDFKANSQKTKSFWKRVEFGMNIQSTRATSFWPVTTDIGLQVGYKITDNASMGAGISYRMGWGKDIQHITITHEGFGLRTYVDWKIRGRLYASGGYEKNYRKQFDNIQQLKDDPEHWQESGLIGLSAKYRLKKKWRGDIKILFDFLYQTNYPATQPVLFRFGYGF